MAPVTPTPSSVAVTRGPSRRALPTNPAASDSVSDPALSELLQVRDASPYVQLYFDTAFGASVGGAMNDAVALLFAGEASPEDIVKDTQQAADQEK